MTHCALFDKNKKKEKIKNRSKRHLIKFNLILIFEKNDTFSFRSVILNMLNVIIKKKKKKNRK